MFSLRFALVSCCWPGVHCFCVGLNWCPQISLRFPQMPPRCLPDGCADSSQMLSLVKCWCHFSRIHFSNSWMTLDSLKLNLFDVGALLDISEIHAENLFCHCLTLWRGLISRRIHPCLKYPINTFSPIWILFAIISTHLYSKILLGIIPIPMYIPIWTLFRSI